MYDMWTHLLLKIMFSHAWNCMNWPLFWQHVKQLCCLTKNTQACNVKVNNTVFIRELKSLCYSPRQCSWPEKFCKTSIRLMDNSFSFSSVIQHIFWPTLTTLLNLWNICEVRRIVRHLPTSGSSWCLFWVCGHNIPKVSRLSDLQPIRQFSSATLHCTVSSPMEVEQYWERRGGSDVPQIPPHLP